MSNLVPEIFFKICKHFFLEDGTKKQFKLPPRCDITSDPFVEYLDKKALGKTKKIVASPSVSPDLAFLSKDMSDIFGLEVKTTKSTTSNINFNSTPPCGKIVVDIDKKETTVPCFYLIVQLVEIEIEGEENMVEIGTMTMIHGDFINSDFELYKQAVGVRTKKIDLGSNGDGMDRQRPMFVFPNPLNIPGIRGERSTLISKEEYGDKHIGKVAELNRVSGEKFYAYQTGRQLTGPFTTVNRSPETRKRSKLKIETSNL
jgi:hypothetical protein